MNETLFNAAAIVGLVALVVMMSCIKSTRRHIDDQKFAQLTGTRRAFGTVFPPERVLKPSGVTRMRIAKYAGAIAGVCFAVMIVKRVMDVHNG
jgi:hypothetical protein